MKKFFSKFLASKLALYFYSTSLSLLYISWVYAYTTNRVGFFRLHGKEEYLSYSSNEQIFFLKKIELILLIGQFILFSIILLISRLFKADEKKSAIMESFINAFTIMNLVLFSMMIAAMNLFFFSSKFDLLFFPISSFVATLFITYFIIKETDEDEITLGSRIKATVNRILMTCSKFNFPYHKLISIAAICICLAFMRYALITKLNTPFVLLAEIIILISGIYLIVGNYFTFKKKDELQRQIILEQNLIRNRFLFGILFIVLYLNITFQIRLDFLFTLLVFAPIMLLSEIFIKDKYE